MTRIFFIILSLMLTALSCEIINDHRQEVTNGERQDATHN